ncbi:MAG: ABC transporter permease [Gammaproteobacteria bacterium]|nr:ABC transporter permease [Gammaproteobacteria bacterium]
MTLSETTSAAILLLLSGNEALWEIISISFSVSLRAILYVTPFALILAYIFSYFRIPGKRVLLSIFNTMLAIPAVVIGLTLYILFSRSGPMGDWRLLFTQDAMIIGQMIMAFPIILVMAHSAIQASDRRLWETAITLGASPIRAMATLFYEVRFGLLAAIVAGFGRIIAEVGCSMMVGGNILHVTRNIPTAIALETSKGEFAQGIALGIVLLILALTLNLGLGFFQGRGELRS